MRGEIEFAPALRERVALLKGLRASAVDEVIDRLDLRPYAERLAEVRDALASAPSGS